MSYLEIIEKVKRERLNGKRGLVDNNWRSEKSELSEKSSPVRPVKVGRCKGDRGLCSYDWLPGFRGLRLGCVTHKHTAGITTVFVSRNAGHNTLIDLLELGMLTGQALTDARRPN